MNPKIQNRISSLETELASLKKTLSAIQMDAVDREIDGLADTASPKDDKLKAEIALLKDSRAALMNQEQLTRAECNRLRSDLKEMQGFRDRALEDLGRAREEIADCKRKMEETKAFRDLAHDDLRRAREKLEENALENARLQQRLNVRNDELVRMANLAAERGNLAQKRLAALSKIEQLTRPHNLACIPPIRQLALDAIEQSRLSQLPTILTPVTDPDRILEHMHALKGLCEMVLRHFDMLMMRDPGVSEEFRKEHPHHDCRLGGYLITFPKSESCCCEICASEAHQTKDCPANETSLPRS